MNNREKSLVINALRLSTDHRLNEIIDFLKISKSSYEYWRKALSTKDKYATLRALITEEFHKLDQARGYRVIWMNLRKRTEPVFVSEKVVRKIMKEEGLKVICKRDKKYSSYKGEPSYAPSNLTLNEDGSHDFHADVPNTKWVSDITEFRLPDTTKVYLSAVIDLFDGKPVGWAISKRPDASLADTSLLMACSQLKPGEHPLCHTDRGIHYFWPGWIALCERHGVTRSMSRKATSPDNAACEGFFGRLKNEFFYGRDWTGVSFDEFASRLDYYLQAFSTRRMKYFREESRLIYDTIDNRRRRLGLIA